MQTCFTQQPSKQSIPITVITPSEFPTWLTAQPSFIQKWLSSTQFKADPNNYSLLPDTNGDLQRVLCIGNPNELWSIGHLPLSLPQGIYHLVEHHLQLAIGWGLGAYQFTRYKKPKREAAQLYLPTDVEETINMVEAIYLTRDLINLPADDLGPTQLAEEATKLSALFKADIQHIVGEDLLKQNYPGIYTVGRASHDAPRLIDLRWGNPKHPKVTLVGKGVCFDTGGLDLKSAAGMLLMKKDMGGAAHVLGLARLIMQAHLPICLRVLIPAVENAVSSNAYRPGDVVVSRKGLTIEIGNTDAEGRIILADALTEAVSEAPDLLIDISTLTGAARIALGTDLPAFFSNQDEVANAVFKHATEVLDPIWRLPLFTLYRELINSSIADINNTGTDSYAGAITAALFLQEFVPPTVPWLHFDLMAWNLKARPGRPLGGEAMALRALFSYLCERFLTSD